MALPGPAQLEIESYLHLLCLERDSLPAHVPHGSMHPALTLNYRQSITSTFLENLILMVWPDRTVPPGEIRRGGIGVVVEKVGYEEEEEDKGWKVGDVVMSRFTDGGIDWGVWPALILDSDTTGKFWETLVQGERGPTSMLVKCIPAGCDWSWHDSTKFKSIQPETKCELTFEDEINEALAEEALEIARDKTKLEKWASQPTDLEKERKKKKKLKRAH
ncbi:PWWP domain protein [Pseudohyphozyma bogoriensis]|nr:PWWP domain protein [Pseudohyphozyma bogoriensis]